MARQDPDRAAASAGQAFQAAEQVDFLAGVEAQAEAAHVAKSDRLTEDERPGGPLADPADQVPPTDDQPGGNVIEIDVHGTATGEAAAGHDLARDCREQFARRL